MTDSNDRRRLRSGLKDAEGSNSVYRFPASSRQLNQTQDARLVQLARLGDQNAYHVLMERHAPFVAAYVASKIRSGADAEDIVQETFWSAYSSLPRLKNPERFGSWAIGIARHKVTDHYRSERSALRRTGSPESLDALPDAAPDPRKSAEMGQVEAAIIDALAGLKERYRIALQMRIFEGRSTSEIGQRLGLKESAVRMRIHRGFKQLRQRLTKMGY